MRWPWRRNTAPRVVFIGGQPPRPTPVAPPPPEPTVELGFADGTTLALADDDPRAGALRSVASYLVGGDKP